jgi:putative hemolysin
MGESSLSEKSLLVSELYRGVPCGKLIVKLAENDAEKEDIFKLRFRIFNEEMDEGLSENKATGLDRDSFDNYCDHLMVLNENQKVVGTYRLLFGPNRPTNGFYSETEFDFTPLSIDFSQAVELGRGCVEKEFRKQTTLMTLFWGIHRYMMGRSARYLLGCGSLPKMTADDAEATFEHLRQRGLVRSDLASPPNSKNIRTGNSSKGVPQVPQLIEFYFQFGAKVIGRPAFDPDFGCFDLLLLFDMDHLSPWGGELLERFDKRHTKDSA